jgi:hypothetical protein
VAVNRNAFPAVRHKIKGMQSVRRGQTEVASHAAAENPSFVIMNNARLAEAASFVWNV